MINNKIKYKKMFIRILDHQIINFNLKTLDIDAFGYFKNFLLII
jgi:hypothetical protein